MLAQGHELITLYTDEIAFSRAQAFQHLNHFDLLLVTDIDVAFHLEPLSSTADLQSQHVCSNHRADYPQPDALGPFCEGYLRVLSYLLQERQTFCRIDIAAVIVQQILIGIAKHLFYSLQVLTFGFQVALRLNLLPVDSGSHNLHTFARLLIGRLVAKRLDCQSDAEQLVLIW